MPTKKCVERKEGFSQVCVWPGVGVLGGEKDQAEFVQFMKEEFGVRVQYLMELLTNPDTVDGHAVEDTGGRNDLFFAVHSDDMSGNFAIKRLQYGIRWIEDVLDNEIRRGECSLYPGCVKEYRTW